jgi:IS605 OrfB family transposase
MKLILQLQLLPTAEQKSDLLSTVERFNEAASFAAEQGFAAKVFDQVSIHHLCYRAIRERFRLSAQMTVRAIAKAVETFRCEKSKCPKFKPRSALCYDKQLLSFKGPTEVSLWSLAGRHRIPFVCGAYQKTLQGRIKGQADLLYRNGKFFLHCTIDVPEGSPIETTDVLGVDLGMVNLATDSDGSAHSGEQVEKVRQRQARNRQRLQRRGSKGAKKLLKRLRRREADFRRHVNHCISKRIVASAKATARTIALEDLKGINQRVSVSRKQRSRHSSWAFRQLRTFIAYKARLAGIPVVLVDPRNTSRTCSVCGHCEKTNRLSQDRFCCKLCGFSCNADFNAARNIRALGRGKPPSELASPRA